MPPQRSESPQGHELTMAVHVLGPVLMTELLRPVLRGHDARTVLVTSGGMYAQALRADDPEYRQGRYSPTTAYARSKRAQVELAPLLAQRWASDSLGVHVTHPGWADTPGVVESLPRFHQITAPLLRDAAGGADTTVWVAATDPRRPPGGSGTTAGSVPRTPCRAPAAPPRHPPDVGVGAGGRRALSGPQVDPRRPSSVSVEPVETRGPSDRRA